MFKFLKENMIFFANSIILVGIVFGVPLLKNTDNSNKIKNYSESISTQAKTNIVAPKTNTEVTVKKIAKPIPTTKTTVKKPVTRYHEEREENDD